MIGVRFTVAPSPRQRTGVLLLLVVLALAMAACTSPPAEEEPTITAPAIPTEDSEGDLTPVASPTLAGEPEEGATETPTAAAETPQASPSPTGETEGDNEAATATPTAAALPTETSAAPEATATSGAAPGNNLPPIDSRETAFSMLASYYDAINREEYERAYGYWRNPEQSLEEFAAGFAETASVSVAVQTPYYGDAGAGNRWAAMPVVLMAVHEDGSRHNFAGCIVAWSAAEGVADPPQTGWSLDRFAIEEVTSTDAATMNDLCENQYDLAGRPFELVDGPVLLIGSYYNAIDREEFDRAYDYWQAPAQSFEEFEQGFENLDTVSVIAGMPYRREAAAGSLYAEVPVLLLATNDDGSQEYFAGCFVAQGSNLPPEEAEQGWSLRDASLQQTDSTDLLQLATLCTE